MYLKTVKTPTFHGVENLLNESAHLGGALEAEYLPKKYSNGVVVAVPAVVVRRVWRDSDKCPQYAFRINLYTKQPTIHWEHRTWNIGKRDAKALLKALGIEQEIV
jgi:hypothetical protein